MWALHGKGEATWQRMILHREDGEHPIGGNVLEGNSTIPEKRKELTPPIVEYIWKASFTHTREKLQRALNITTW